MSKIPGFFGTSSARNATRFGAVGGAVASLTLVTACGLITAQLDAKKVDGRRGDATLAAAAVDRQADARAAVQRANGSVGAASSQTDHGFGEHHDAPSGGSGTVAATPTPAPGATTNTATATSSGGDTSTVTGTTPTPPPRLAAADVAKTVALAYTGRSLTCKSASGTGDVQLPMKYGQKKLLSLYQGDEDWLASALGSLEQSDYYGAYRPTGVLHRNLRHRINLLSKYDPLWSMNLIRFRITEDTAQIKINYEGDLWAASAHESILYIALIHSIAIADADRDEFVRDVAAIPQDESRAGCQIEQILDKWLARGSYWFLHTNILDQNSGPNQWVWTEHLVFTGTPTIKAGCEDFMCMNSGMMTGNIQTRKPGDPFADMRKTQDQMMESQSGGQSLADADGDGVPDYRDKCPNLGAGDFGVDADGCPLPPRTWVGAHGSLAGKAKAGAKLEIAPMAFKRFVWKDATKSLEEKKDGTLYLWFSGSEADQSINLVESEAGERLPLMHPARNTTDVYTCAQCHARGHIYDAKRDDLIFSRSMNFRMVGYGFGSFFGIPRPNHRAAMAPFLVATATPQTDDAGPIQYKLMGDATKAKDQCEPWGGCTGCSYHQDFKWCLADAAYLPTFKNSRQALKIEFPTLAAELAKHTKKCIADVEAKLEEFGQCDFLICAEQRARSGMTLAGGADKQKALGEFNDPTFGCGIEEPFSRLRSSSGQDADF